MIKYEKAGMVTPAPYFKIGFSCSNRRFYEVKAELYDIATGIDIEIQDGYITEKCDYEGDLEEIIIYNCDRGDKLISAVLEYYGLSGVDHKDRNIHLSIR
jgi:hypothetical protein